MLSSASAGFGAERIEFFVGPFEPTIWVEDLEVLAQDGTVTERFSGLADRFDDQELRSLRTFLNASLDVDLISISQASYWQVGERFLDRMGQVVQTDNFLNGSRALRAVLIAAAADGDSITVLELLQEYPLDVIQLDFPLMQQIIREYQRFFANRETTVAQLRTIDDTRNRPLLTTGLQPTQTGPYSWQQETLNFQNPLRDGDIPFDVYLPQTAPLSDVNAAASVPIIVFSHGVASGRQALRYLAQHLASHGYAVVVPQHYDDNRKYFQFLAGIENPLNPITLISRPQDISNLLDKLEQLANTRQGYSQLALDNVGVLGHSLGGFTVLAAAGAELNFELVMQNCSIEDRDRPSLNPSLLVQCDLTDLSEQAPFQLQDERIQAVFALNPPTSLFFGETGLAQLDIPTLMMAATADIVVPAIPEQIEPYRGLQVEERYLVVMENALVSRGFRHCLVSAEIVQSRDLQPLRVPTYDDPRPGSANPTSQSKQF
ncbi:MAG: alpha/beta hydrolase, partial [Cyanobacteria bacterium P01_C01_bin.118]